MSAMETPAVSFPLGGVDDGRMRWSSANASVREVLWNILLTRPGERVMRPEFGAGLMQFVHQPNNQTTRRLMADVALKAVQRWEPRIDVIDLKVESDPRNLSQVVLTLDYRLRASGIRETMNLALQLQS